MSGLCNPPPENEGAQSGIVTHFARPQNSHPRTSVTPAATNAAMLSVVPAHTRQSLGSPVRAATAALTPATGVPGATTRAGSSSANGCVEGPRGVHTRGVRAHGTAYVVCLETGPEKNKGTSVPAVGGVTDLPGHLRTRALPASLRPPRPALLLPPPLAPSSPPAAPASRGRPRTRGQTPA